MQSKTRQRGFTLVEVMIVVVIVGILAAVTIPQIIGSLPRYRLRAAARELVIDFKKVKMEAVKRNRDVLLQFTLVAVGADAGGSYQLCVDDNNNDSCDAVEVFKTVNMPPRVRLVTTTFAAPDLHRAGFTNRGLPWKNHLGAVTLNTSDGARTYQVSLTIAGGVRLQ